MTLSGKAGDPGKTFRHAVETADHLVHREGMQALKEGKGQVVAAETSSLLGGVNMDDDCRDARPNDNRWDYLVGVKRSKHAVAFFIEVHSAETSEVSKIEKKLQWLLDFLERPAQSTLKSIPREVHWVASGRINIPKHLPQYKKLQTTLRARGLLGPIKQLKVA